MSHNGTANDGGNNTQSTSVDLDRFAFGLDTVETDSGVECDCPMASYSTLTGEQPLPMDHVMAAYDKILRTKTNETTGVVDENTARDAWLSAIDTVLNDEYKTDFHVENARRLADDFGWL